MNNETGFIGRSIDSSGIPVFEMKRIISKKTMKTEEYQQTDGQRLDRFQLARLDSTLYRNWFDGNGNPVEKKKSPWVNRIRLFGHIHMRAARDMFFNYSPGNLGWKRVLRSHIDNTDRYGLNVLVYREWESKARYIQNEAVKHAKSVLGDDFMVWSANLKNDNGNNEIAMHSFGFMITTADGKTVLREIFMIGDVMVDHRPEQQTGMLEYKKTRKAKKSTFAVRNNGYSHSTFDFLNEHNTAGDVDF